VYFGLYDPGFIMRYRLGYYLQTKKDTERKATVGLHINYSFLLFHQLKKYLSTIQANIKNLSICGNKGTYYILS
jgi:hypothetical protein